MVEAIREAAPGHRVRPGVPRRLPPRAGVRRPAPDAARTCAVGDLAEIWDEPAVKLLAQHLTLDPDDFRARVIDAVGEPATPTWTTDRLMEISAVGVTKGGALAALCERLGVDADEVVAFGDMPNDLPMLTWAGTSYAVANAHESVLAAADHVAPRNDEDGVAVDARRAFRAVM